MIFMKRKTKQRIVSLLTVVALTMNVLPLGEFSNGISSLFSIAASAVELISSDENDFSQDIDSIENDNVLNISGDTSYIPTNEDTAVYEELPVGDHYDITFGNETSFVDYCYHYNHTEGFANKHKNDVLSLSFTNTNLNKGVLRPEYEGLGNSGAAFNGTVKCDVTLQMHRSFFGYVTDNAKLLDLNGNVSPIKFIRLSDVGDGERKPILADVVQHNGSGTSSEWKVTLESTSNQTYSGLIGELAANASVKINYTNNSPANIVSNSGAVGAVCGTMGSGSAMELTYSASHDYSITASNGNAGGLVGTITGASTLTLKGLPSVTPTVESTAGYAGGLVGELTSSATISNQIPSTPAIPVSGTVIGSTGSGGLFGHYTNSAASFDFAAYNNAANVCGGYSGGYFGYLENNAASLTFSNTTLTVSSASGTGGNYFGGIAGQYTANALADTLTLSNIIMNVTSSAAFSNGFGGIFGQVNSDAYINVSGVIVNAIGTTSGCFGGLVGETTAGNGVFIDLGDFTVKTGATGNESFHGGGIVGSYKAGVLRLSGTTDMSNAKPAEGSSNYGQLVGIIDNVLVYDSGNWTFKRCGNVKADDLGTWGEVVRISGIENNILTVDVTTAHTVTLGAAATSIGTPTDFVKTALNIQLNQGNDYGCLKFTSGNNTRSSLLAATLTLTADISLAGTGVNGFMRDGGDSVGAFTGTLNGGSKTVTLAIGEKYGSDSTGAAITSSTAGEGLGQIYAHPYNGLFAVIGNGATGTGTVNSLTIAGNIDVRNTIDGMNIGGIAAVSKGNTSLSDITASQTVNYGEPSSITGTESAGKNIGGLIGLANGSDNGTIAITGTNTISTTFNISDNYKSWNALGAFIGKVTSPKFTINIAQGSSDTLTVSHTMVDNSFSAGSNADGGGLIGYITSGTYSNRKINIKNLNFNNCTIINKASTNGGGFLGYAWLDTDTTIDGLTVTDGTITNSSANVGVMCYVATGKWKVNSLTVTKMSLSGGAGTSLGMLVNKAYNGSNGLYLDVLNAGYTLTKQSGNTGITLPGSLNKYDELAAYSAADADGVLAGGAGVISINMNAAGSTATAAVTSTGTYQNKLSVSTSQTSNYANATARYYYNLDKMSNTDDGQNLVLWSVSKYAASNISDEFIQGTGETYGTTFTNTISGAADMRGLSYYPIALKDSVTLNGLTLTMDYSGLFGAESTFTANNPDDSYVRDPGATGNDKNQHYLMQSGLFTSLLNTKTLTISGENTLKGDFLELSGVSGVLISGTSNGSIVSSSGSTLVLDGIVAKTAENIDYDDGYLLVNNITRVSSILSADDITIRLEGIRTTNTYTSGATVAKSLLGAASGNNLNIEFTKIKLDSRESGTLSGNTALNTAYGTASSIFTDSTLLASIYTDDKAQLKYYYTIEEDWGSTGSNGTRWVTYGKEIKSSLEYRELVGSDYVSLENKYDGSNYYTHPTTPNSGSEYGFSTGFLPYVARPFASAQANALYYRELKVNVAAEGLTVGCGSYNDPYIITDGKQFVAVSQFILNGTTEYLSKVNLPKVPGNYDSIGKNTSGARWCTDKIGTDYHLLFTPNNGGTGYENGSTTWDAVNVQYYLANAYYKLEGNITLSGDSSRGFVGLGGNTANTAFRGVIVGDKNQDDTPRYTITNNSNHPFVNVSNGCVVKDVAIIQNADVSVAQTNAGSTNAYFGYNSKCAYYGGMIGEIMGGDNIIDNSYVTYSSGKTVTLSGTNGTIVPVGGYVGVIVYGGLIFKNMTTTVNNAAALLVNNSGLTVYYNDGTTTHTDNNLAANTDAAKAAIYVNPIVGRVINGYAVNEGTALSVTENGTYHDDSNSGAGTARTGTQHTLKNGKKHYSIADIKKYSSLSEAEKLDVTAVATASADGNINVPNAQALFILSLITQSGAGTATEDGGEYVKSLSYGTYGTTSSNVYGMSHNAEYSDVGTNESSSSNVDDYNDLASSDTAANTAVPYIIKHYTEIKERTVGGEIDHGWTISFDDSGTTKYLKLSGDGLTIDTNPYYFSDITKESGYWKIQQDENSHPYIQCKWTNGFAGGASWDDGAKLDLYNSDGTQYTNETIDGNSFYLSNKRPGSGTQGARYYFEGTKLPGRWVKAVTDINLARLVTFNHVVEDTTQTLTPIYARCVTSTLGYYNINLTGSGTYQLPDSFRGLGCVGIYDTVTGVTNPYSIKLNTFNGNGCTIDEDIYLNKFYSDNYFNVLHAGASQDLSSDSTTYSIDTSSDEHGIGLFDSVIMKSGGKFYNFTLKGSVKTVMFSNSYSATDKEYTGVPDSGTLIWHSTGGVCGWSIGNQAVNFNNISLDNMTINGSNYVGGLLAHSGNNSNSHFVTITQCSATAISLKMAASQINGNPRNAMGAFVGKVRQGKVVVYGTSSGTGNTNSAMHSDVTIKSYSFGNNTQNFYVSVGGLVGYSGHGFEAYDMNVSSSIVSGTTIGNDKTGICGGIIGVMQPYSENNDAATAIFKNCTVHNINVQGNMAGGIYGGKWLNSNWVPYRIEMINCNVEGRSSSAKNSITGGGYAGGLVGNGIVYTRKDTTKENANVIISDCKVSNYNIISNTKGYSGGFVGYCNSVNESITCYIHDSSVEDCVLGQSGDKDYAGGAIGGIAQKDDNKIVGYNIKLDNVTSSSNRMGAWVGYLEDSKTSIQFTGMAIYGTGYDKNIGDIKSGVTNNNASFVFADYSGASENFVTTTTSSTSAAKQEGDEDSQTETFTPNSTAKTVTRVVTTVTVGDENTTTETQTTVYPYISVSTAAPVSNSSLTESSSVWAVHEDSGTITYTVSDASNHTVTVTTYKLAVSDYNNTNNVVMPKYPYVNVNPQSDMGTEKIISGDGAVLASSPSSTAAYSGKTAESTMALKIYEDMYLTDQNAENYSRRYSTFSDTAVYNSNGIDYYMKRNKSDDGDRISNYYTEKGYTSAQAYDNFACVVIANNTTEETTALINRYIQLVTNTSTDYMNYSPYYSVAVSSCQYSSTSNKFDISNSSGGLTWTPPVTSTSAGVTTTVTPGSFALNPSGADSLSSGDTFTLVDVQFKDPLDTNKIAYHLYVPVYTIKQIDVTFNVAVKSSTNSVYSQTSNGVTTETNDYTLLMNKLNNETRTHVDNLESWVTHYIRYSYSAADINALLNDNNVNWNHNKSVIFRTTTGGDGYRLPGDTYMVLVDPNGNSDVQYYANASDFDPDTNTNITGWTQGWNIDLTKFKRGNNNFAVSTLNTVFAKSLVATQPQNEPRYYDVGTSNDYNVYLIDSAGNPQYYKYRADGNGTYKIAVKEGVTVLHEDYYISMYVPRPAGYNGELYNYTVTPPSTLLGIKAANVVVDNDFNVIVGELFDQTTTNGLVVGPELQQITTSDHKICVTAKTTISFKTPSLRYHFGASNSSLYHSFNISLNRYTDSGMTNDIIGLLNQNNTKRVYAKYAIGQECVASTNTVSGEREVVDNYIELTDNYLNIVTAEISNDLQLAAANSQPLTVSCYVEMDFDVTKLEAEFPQRASESNIGVNVAATSNLEYDKNRLAFSSIQANLPENSKFYYRESVNAALLNYFEPDELDEYERYGRMSQNQTRLGVNGFCSDETNMPIVTQASYNVAALSSLDIASAENVRLNITLSKKTDTVVNGVVTKAEYIPVEHLTDYLNPNVLITSGSNYTTTVAGGGTTLGVIHPISNNADHLEVTIPKDQCKYDSERNVFDFGIEYSVITGPNFHDYANYKVTLKVEMLDSTNKVIGNSTATGYIVYTNAKVYPTAFTSN